ncbi:MAG: UDP-2,3-diacylglucosamine diphosphatase LpxI [Candidatus Omnitrophica bacterium]|nr:UDP-2,3-diacylglucosamine diphosphatase LpxI [Candidatus Omnitrophota bacterium]MCM8798959.1 UDP-2,3-diacylglucosamine diphosphatase LpxI [Candidatus Omnitrophota bacterium]
MSKKIGLIAGRSRYPLLLAEAAKKQGVSVFAVGIKGETLPELANYVSEVYWLDIGEWDKLIGLLKRAGIKEAIMAGGISKTLLFRNDLHLDRTVLEILNSLKDKRDMSILNAFAQQLKNEGIELLDATLFLEDLLPGKGGLTERLPNSGEWEDIKFGWDIAKEIARLDIGMTVVVKNKVVLAVEAMEGTDETIRRGASLGGEGTVVIKVSRFAQDKRFDLPVIGQETIKVLREVKARVLAIEAGEVIFIDRAIAIEEANKAGLAIVAL